MKFLRDVPLRDPPDELSPARLHDVVTRQCSHEKLMVPARELVASPEKTPDASIDTPPKSIHPVCSPQANPERSPLPSFITPPFEGERLIQPSIALQTYPVIPESVT